MLLLLLLLLLLQVRARISNLPVSAVRVKYLQSGFCSSLRVGLEEILWNGDIEWHNAVRIRDRAEPWQR